MVQAGYSMSMKHFSKKIIITKANKNWGLGSVELLPSKCKA
jgi:hypothetical protein